MDDPTLHQDSAGWLIFVHAAFAVALGLTCFGIFWLSVDPWIKGYFVMGLCFTVGSSFTLAKTLRDQHEARKLLNRVKEAKTERLLHDYELKTPTV